MDFSVAWFGDPKVSVCTGQSFSQAGKWNVKSMLLYITSYTTFEVILHLKLNLSLYNKQKVIQLESLRKRADHIQTWPNSHSLAICQSGWKHYYHCLLQFLHPSLHFTPLCLPLLATQKAWLLPMESLLLNRWLHSGCVWLGIIYLAQLQQC